MHNRASILLLLLIIAVGLRATPPDASAWAEPRNYHAPFDESYREHIKLSRSTSVTAASATSLFSTNRTCRLDLLPSKGDGQTIELVVSTGTASFRIIVQNTYPNFPVQTQWINEKLVFIRVWWGRVVGSDFIFDAETGRFIHQEMINDGTVLFQQTQQAKSAAAGTVTLTKD